MPSMLALGEASYALYIFQEPVLVWLTAVFKRIAPSMMAHWFWIGFALLVAVSLAVHKYLEQPLRRVLGERLGKVALRPAAP